MYQPQAPDTLDESSLSAWRKAITAAKQVREDVAARFDWQGNIDRYAPKDAKKAEGDVNIGADFADVERKKAALFYASPKISFVPDQPLQELVPAQPPQPGQPPPPQSPTLGQVAGIHQDLVNELLSDSQLGVKGTVGKAILDVLLPAGVGPVRVGYTATTQAIPVADPMTGIEQDVPIPIHEELFVSRISPMALLLPAEFRDTDIRNASWVGYEFALPETQVRAEYRIPEDVELNKGGDKPYFHKDDQLGDDADPPVTGVYIEYKAAHFGMSKHPEAVWCLVLTEGNDTPLKHGPSAHQTFDEQGRLTPDSLRGFSILPLWTRDLPDSAWVPSDSTITGPLTREINRYRSQAIEHRDNTRNVIVFDSEVFGPDITDKIEKGEIGAMIPVKGASLGGGIGSIMAQVATSQLPRESYTGADQMMGDRERILGIGANTTGAQSSNKRSATEVNTVQRNTEARFNKEQARVREWFLSVVRALDTLVLRYADARFAAQLVGQVKGELWFTHKAVLAGGYRYEVQSDSGKYLDAEALRRQTIQFYQMVRQDPLINPKPILSKLVSLFGIDPSEGIVEPQPTSPPPPPVSFSFKGDDLNPLNPQFGLIVKLAQQGGWKIEQTDIDAAKAEANNMLAVNALANVNGTPGQPAPDMKHGGPATQQMPLSKRQEGETGGISGQALQ